MFVVVKVGPNAWMSNGKLYCLFQLSTKHYNSCTVIMMMKDELRRKYNAEMFDSTAVTIDHAKSVPSKSNQIFNC